MDNSLRYAGTAYRSQNVLPLTKQIGLLGGTAQASVANEIHRVYNQQAKEKRRNAAIHAGFFTLLVLGGSGYLLAESIISTIRLSQPDAVATMHVKLLNYIELALLSTSVLLTLLAIPWLRSRRPSFLSKTVMTAGFCVFLIETAAAVLNGAFIYVWEEQVKSRCDGWAVDVAWYQDNSQCTQANQTGTISGYLIAAGIRLVIVLLLSLLWMYFLFRFYRILPLAGDRLHQETASSLSNLEAVKEILQRHECRLVALAENDTSISQRESQLPHMPSERILADDEVQQKEKPQNTFGWLWNSVGWLFGYSNSEKGDSQTADFTRKEASSPLLMQERPRSREDRFPSPVQSRFIRNPLHPDYELVQSPIAKHSFQPSLPPGAALRPLPSLPGTKSSATPSRFMPAFPNFLKGHTRSESDQAASFPLVDQHSSLSRPSSPAKKSQNQTNNSHQGLYDGVEWQEYDSDNSEVDTQEHLHDSSLEGSSVLAPLPKRNDKQKVYIQMSDGGLVRKLSTICSEGTGEMSRSASMDSGSLLDRDFPGAYRRSAEWSTSTTTQPISQGRRNAEAHYQTTKTKQET